ncbi:hypothetical protein [Paraburkholderia graminis]|uniref:hypothetical protein n=1 Tax=Paraburkholderia graminis TaxID=60548 RepID=UPI0031DF2FD2
MASLLTACVPHLLTTDINLQPGDTTARLRIRFAGDGALSVVQFAPSKCYAYSDRAIRSLTTINKGEHTLIDLSLISTSKLGMPNDLDGVPKNSYEEILVKAGTPIDFGVSWFGGDQFVTYRGNGIGEFVPETGKDYELRVVVAPKKPMHLLVEELQVSDGNIVRVPVTMNEVHLCGT